MVKEIMMTLDPLEFQFNYKHPNLRFEKTDRMMELDIYNHGNRIAFEYQGHQHFEFHYQSGSGDVRMNRDNTKRMACKMENITLIEIPYWWDRKMESLYDIIKNIRPDLNWI
jgi:hypothetical protein